MFMARENWIKKQNWSLDKLNHNKSIQKACPLRKVFCWPVGQSFNVHNGVCGAPIILLGVEGSVSVVAGGGGWNNWCRGAPEKLQKNWKNSGKTDIAHYVGIVRDRPRSTVLHNSAGGDFEDFMDALSRHSILSKKIPKLQKNIFVHILLYNSMAGITVSPPLKGS